MTILGLCFNGSIHGVPAHHEHLLVLISYIIAVFASFTALEMGERLRSASAATRVFWLVAAAIALGGGVWSTHFLGMLAYKIPLAQAYDPLMTIASGAIAVAAVATGLQIFQSTVTWRRVALAGVLVGLGVAAMHYCGMAALRVPGQIYYRPGLFALSVVIAVTAASIALWLAHVLRFTWQRGAAALVMALAICGMHYTAMAATVIVAGPPALRSSGGLVQSDDLALVVTFGVTLIFGLGLVCAFVDRRSEQMALREADRLRALNLELAERTQSLTDALADLDHARRAQAATLAKSELMSNMSHELRTPLNAILGFAQLMQLNSKREPLTPRQGQAVKHIVNSGAHLLKLIEAVLDLASLDSAQASMHTEPLDIAQILLDLRDSFADEAKRASVALIVDCDRAQPSVHVAADRRRLSQILSSLVSNAIIYNRPGGLVRMSIEALGERVAIAIGDTGQGIPATMLPSLFQPFNRLGREGGAILGAGVSLTISKRLAEAMGGELTFKSVDGEGSTFTVIMQAERKPIDVAASTFAHEQAA